MSVEKPIIVNESALPDQLAAALRQVALIFGGWLVGRGYLEQTTVEALGALALIAVPLIYGQWRTFFRAKQLSIVAASPRVPDSVAQIKGE